MRKLLLFSAVLSLFLLVPASITWAQTVSVTGNVYEKNTVKNTFKTPHGSITAILPDDMAAGDIIRGSIIYQPEGRRENEKNKNLEQLLGYKLFLDNGTALKAETEHDKHVFVTELTIPPLNPGNNLRLIVRDPQNNIVGESRVPLMDKSILMSPVFLEYDNIKSKATAPIIQTDKTVYLSGENAAISLPPVLGKIILEDHIISFVQFSMAGQKPEPVRIELQPLVSSPRRMVVQIPPNLYGPGEITLENKNKKVIASQKIHVLQLEASCPKTSLLKGEKTVLKVTVNGLKDCPADYIRLNLDNVTSTSVQLGQSNHEELVVKLITKTDTRLNEDSIADIITKINWDNKPQDENTKLAIKNRNVEDAEQYANDKLSLQRSVTALQSGSFTINIGLSYPSSGYNDPFRQQLDALKTVEQFNNWQNALKADSSGEHIPEGMIEICRRLSPITSPAELDEAKSRVYNIISWPRIGQEVIVDFIDGALEAGKAAVQNAIDNAGTAAVNIEMIQTALRSAGKKADIAGNTALKDAAGNSLKEDMLKLQQAINSESEKIQILSNIQKVLDDASRAAVNNILASATRNKVSPENFNEAVIAEISFPAMDAAEKDRALLITLQYIPEKISYNTGNEKIKTPLQPKEKTWMVSNFEIKIDGLPGNQFKKIDDLKFTFKITQDQIGSARNYRIIPDRIVIPELKFSVPQQDIDPIMLWQTNFSKSNEFKKGSLDYLDASGQTLFSFSFDKIKPVQVSPTRNNYYNVVIRPEEPGFITRVPDGWSDDGPPIQFEQKELKEPRKLDDKALQIGLHVGIKKLIADAAGARGQTWNTVCDNCRQCIEARMGEWAADLVKDLGVGIIKEYLGAAVSLIGEAVKAVGAAKEFFDKISDKVDNAEKLADDIADKIKKGELQVIALEPKFCVKSEYCQTRGTIFYNPKTGCVFAIIYCEGTKMCCPNAQTIITMTYCTDDKGMPTQVPDIDVIKK